MPTGIYTRTKKHLENMSRCQMGRIAWNKGKKMPAYYIYNKTLHKNSPEIRKKISEAHKKSGFQPPHGKGDKCPNWRGGVTPKNKLIRTSKEYKTWRQKILRRDNYTCVLCGYKSRGTKPPDIHADHIKSFANHEKLRFDLNNGRTLCVPCHKKTPNFSGKSIKKNQVNKRATS